MNQKNILPFLTLFNEKYAGINFDYKETMQWLTINKPIAMSWGISDLTPIGRKGLLFFVNGYIHKGWILITLEGDDTYTVRLLEIGSFNLIKETKMVYCDVLQTVIDKDVEKDSNTPS